MSEPSRRPGRLGVGVIGAGRVGAVLGAALRAAGHAVVGVTAVSEASRERAELLLPEVPILTPQEVVERAELVLLAVPDDQLPGLVRGLAETGHWQAGQLVAHTAGRWGVEVLEPARQAGAIGLAIHPSMTFTGLSMDLPRLTDCSFGVTAPAAVLPIAQALVLEMGGEPVVIAEADRSVYHTSLTHGANHLTTIIGQCLQLLGELGLAQPERVLGPLVRASLENALSSGESALTGPVARGDIGTVLEHRLTLAESALGSQDHDILDAYVALARATADRALTRGLLSPQRHDEILSALGRPEPTTRPTAQPPAPEVDSPGAAAETADGGEPGAQDRGAPFVVGSPVELRQALRGAVATSGPGATIGLVPTMGALHEGHAHLVRRARAENDIVAVSVFVNPLQFGPGEDFERYPSDLPADLELLTGLGVDLVFAPDLEQMYPDGRPLVSVSSGRLGAVLDGASRPGHFDGVVTVVNKLLTLASGHTGDRPLRAYFGQKDAQQLLIVRRMVRDTDLDVEIRAVPIMRAPDGLALSSRNAYLDDDERRAALVLSRTLAALAEGRIDLERARTAIDAEPIGAPDGAAAATPTGEGAGRSRSVELDYLVVVDPGTLEETAPEPGALALVAARVGATRLIDNRVIDAAPNR